MNDEVQNSPRKARAPRACSMPLLVFSEVANAAIDAHNGGAA